MVKKKKEGIKQDVEEEEEEVVKKVTGKTPKFVGTGTGTADKPEAAIRVTEEEYRQEKNRTGTPIDPVIQRRQQRETEQQQEQLSQALLPEETTQESATVETTPIQQQEQMDEQAPSFIENTKQLLSLNPFDVPRDEQGNPLVRGNVMPVTVGGVGGVSGIEGTGLGAPNPITYSLEKSFDMGKVGGVLSAPTKAKAITASVSKTLLLFAGSFIGVTSFGSLVGTVTANMRSLEGDVSKYGEQLTKIPESAKLGVRIDDDNDVVQYTPQEALRDINEINDALLEAEKALQEQSLGNIYLKIFGKWKRTKLEIEKQKKEIAVAQGKTLQLILSPSQEYEDMQRAISELEIIKANDKEKTI